jgi:hypothetical protein
VASESTWDVTALVASCILLAATVSGDATGICNNIFSIIFNLYYITAAKIVKALQKKD